MHSEGIRAPMFKVGDEVIILSGKDFEPPYGPGWVHGMEDFVGQTATIYKVFPSIEADKYPTYKLRGLYFTWEERGLELVEEDNSASNIIETDLSFLIN